MRTSNRRHRGKRAREFVAVNEFSILPARFGCALCETVPSAAASGDLLVAHCLGVVPDCVFVAAQQYDATNSWTIDCASVVVDENNIGIVGTNIEGMVFSVWFGVNSCAAGIGDGSPFVDQIGDLPFTGIHMVADDTVGFLKRLPFINPRTYQFIGMRVHYAYDYVNDPADTIDWSLVFAPNISGQEFIDPAESSSPGSMDQDIMSNVGSFDEPGYRATTSKWVSLRKSTAPTEAQIEEGMIIGGLVGLIAISNVDNNYAYLIGVELDFSELTEDNANTPGFDGCFEKRATASKITDGGEGVSPP